MKAYTLIAAIVLAGCAPEHPELSARTKQCVLDSLDMEGEALAKKQHLCLLLAKTDCLEAGGGEWCLR